MRLVVDGAAGTVEVEDAGNPKALSVVLRFADEDLAKELLKDVGSVGDGHVWLDIDTLRSFEPALPVEHWDAHNSATRAWAEEHGWTEVTGQQVCARLERSGC